MASKTVCVSSGTASQSANLTRYYKIFGKLLAVTTELNTILNVRPALSVRDFNVIVSANTVSASSTFALLKNSVVSALAVSIGSNTTGNFHDNTDTISYAALDDIGTRLVTGTTGTSLTAKYLSLTIDNDEAGDDAITQFGSGNIGDLTQSSGQRFAPLNGGADYTVSATGATQHRTRINALSGTRNMKNLHVRISANTRTTATSVQLWKDGSATGTTLSMSITAGTTGEFEDIDSWSHTADSDYNYTVTNGSGAGGIFVQYVSVVFQSEKYGVLCSSNREGVTYAAGSTNYISASGDLEAQSNENHVVTRQDYGVSCALFGFHIRVLTNTATATGTGRVRNTDTSGIMQNSSLVVSVGSGATGLFSDNTNVTYTNVTGGDFVDYSWVNGTGGTTILKVITCMEYFFTAHDKQLSDTYNVTDSVGRLAGIARTLTDTYNVTDTVGFEVDAGSIVRELSDTYNVTDSVSVNVSRTRELTDTYNVADSVSRSQELIRAISETYNVQDVVTRSQILVRLLTDSYNVTDSLNRMITFLRELGDTYNVTDTINRLVTFVRIIQDTYNVADSVVKSQNLTRVLTDTYNITDTVSRSQSLTRILTDTYNVTDVVSKLRTVLKSLSESYNITDTESHTAIITKTLTDTYNVVDSLDRNLALTRSLTDTYNVSDIVTRFQQLIREITDTYSITDTVQREQILTRVLTDTYNVTDSVSNASLVIVSLEETYNITDTVIRSLIMTRALSETYDVNDSIDRLLQLVRVVTDVYDVNEVLIREVAVTRSLSNESYNVTDEVTAERRTGITVNLSESFDINDSVLREQILQRMLFESYDVMDTVFKEGGEPIIIDEDAYKVTGGGGGHISQNMFNKLKRRMMIKTLNDFLPRGFPDKIIIDNQKAFFLDNKIPQNRINAQTVIKPTKNNRFLNNVYSWKEKQIDLQIENTMRELKKNKIDTQTYIRSLPKKVLITNYDNVNNVLLNHNLNQISASVIIEKKGHLNSLYSPIIIETNIQPNSITNGIKILNSSDKSNNNILSNSVYINYKDNNTLNNAIIVKPRSASIIKGNITEYKKDKVKKIKDFMLNRTKYTTYENLLKDIIFKNKDQDKKENLMYYISTYQTRFDIERTNTNKDMVKLEKSYQSKIKNLYKKIFDEYKTQPHRMSEMREKYHKPVYDLIRSISDKGYDLGIDYVSKATGRPDIYLTETDIENVKYQSDKSTIHFFESIEKQIKKEVIKESAESLTESYVPPTDMTIEGATSLLIGSLSTGLVALATISKLQQIQDLFIDQNVPIKFVFITERDIRVCPYCSTLDYRISNYEFTLNNINMMPKPPIHLNCRCRILLKIGQRIIVK